MRLVLIAFVLAAAVVAAVLLLRYRRTVVIGRQLAAADARDRLHRQQFAHLSSPLPQRRYEPARGEMTLIDPQISDLDHEISSVCARYSASSTTERRNFRNAATGDDFYTLLNFARRASVFALRNRDEAWIQNALTAVAMIDVARIDERDLPLTLSLVHHAAEKLQRRPLQMFDAATALAEPGTAEIIGAFVRQSETDKDIQSSWGYQEIQGPAGAGFVQREFNTYQPTSDLLKVALSVRNAIGRDRYEGDVTLATDLPSVWFPKPARERVESILARSVATASVHGVLRPGEHERADAQSFLVFIVETRSEEDAAALHALASNSSTGEPATIAVDRGRLFALAVGRSFEVGVPSYETPASMKRFEGPFLGALQA